MEEYQVGDTVKLQYQPKPGCLPEIATVLSTWWDHTGTILHIEIHCPKLGGTRHLRADTYEVVRANKASV